MKKKQSAGILLYRLKNKKLEVLLVHPGGPLWTKRDDGVWSIPKGEFTDDEAPLDAAKREFEEEVGSSCSGDFVRLTPVVQKSGKIVHAWAVQGDLDAGRIRSNTFAMEWPRGSGTMQEFPEIDRGAWFGTSEAGQKINSAQTAFIHELEEILHLVQDGTMDSKNER